MFKLNQMTLWAAFIGLGLAVTSSTSSLASDFQSPRTAALGGAGHAAPMLADAIYLNPSYGSLSTLHSISFSYPTFPEGHILNLSVLDGSRDSMFQAGVGYTRREDSTLIHLGASKGLAERIGVGIGTKFILPNDNSGQRIADATLSVTGIVSRFMQASLIIDNLFTAAPAMGFRREIILGTKIDLDNIVLLFIDPHWVPDLPNMFGYEAGAELPFSKDFFLRVGVFKNSQAPSINQRSDGYGIGGGWIAPRMSLDYAYTRILAPTDTYVHNFGMTIYF